MRCASGLLSGVLLTGLCGLARGAETEAAPPTADQISKWITQLDDDKFATRSEATDRLQAAGSAATPAVAEAARSESAEVSSRALEILEAQLKSDDKGTQQAAREALEKLAKDTNTQLAKRAAAILAPEDPEDTEQGIAPAPAIVPGLPQGALPPGALPGVFPPNFRPQGGAIQIIQMQAQNINGRREVQTTDNGRKVKIVDDPQQGITVEVTETVEGKEKTSKYEAKNAEELAKKHPEADKLFKKYGGPNGIQVQFQALPGGPQGIPQIQLAPAIPIRVANVEKISELRKRLKGMTQELDKHRGEKADEKFLEEFSNDLKELSRELGDSIGEADASAAEPDASGNAAPEQTEAPGDTPQED